MIRLKAILPGRFDGTAFERNVRKAVQETGKKMRRDFDSTTATWDTQVQFRTRDFGGGSNIGVEVYTENQVYYWVSEGTNGPGGAWYPIRPRNASRLSYQVYYRRKTRAGVLAATSGGKYGPWTMRSRVYHPGIRVARKFDELVAHLNLPVLEGEVARAMELARSQSGHAI